MSHYSQDWFSIFLNDDNYRYYPNEITFLKNLVSLDQKLKILDIACGNGRHLKIFDSEKHEMTGIDVNLEVLNEIRDPNIKAIELDMRNLADLSETSDLDLIILMWQSFGYFDDAVNSSIISQISALLKPMGVFLLEIYNPEFFEKYQGTRKTEVRGISIKETKIVQNHRLQVDLEYGNGGSDSFNWRLYTPKEIINICNENGLELIFYCSNFTEGTKPTEEDARIQYVFQKHRNEN